MLKVVQHPAAARDLASIARYLTSEAGRAKAHNFLYEVQIAYRLLAQMPEIGAPRSYGNTALKSLRIWLVPNFKKYVIFYVVDAETLTIIRILHGSRDIQTVLSHPEET
jgi:toxin ParE1/3/4